MSNENEQSIFTDDLKNALADGWTWLREHPSYWRSTQEGLEIRVEPGKAEDVQNALLRPAPDRSQGTYAIEIDVLNHTHPIQQYEQAGITWYVDGKPVFKLVKELIDGGLFIIPGRKEMPTQCVRLRLIVTANSWIAQYRPEGESEFQTAETGDLPAPNDDQLSIQCYNGPEEGEHWIRFSNFCIEQL